MWYFARNYCTSFTCRNVSSWLVSKNSEMCSTVIDGLKKSYKNSLLPLEEISLFHEFHTPQLHDADFEAKPMVLLMGQYSTGKTTFVKHLLKSDFPGGRIGPEPTTDSFIAVMYGDKDNVIPGNSLVVDPDRQFRPLAKFGNQFLNRFQCSLVNSPVLKSMTFIDTPGILSGEKQRVDRGYDFTGVLKWFAERVDRILVMFDAHKLDISDELKRSIEVLHGHDDKIRIILNKADTVDHQQLMRVYGALMWSLGKILLTPEVTRVFIGSFWDHPLKYDSNRRLLEDEEQDLLADLKTLPRNSTVRKLTDLSKRARAVKVHACILHLIGRKMPTVFGKESKKKEIIDHLKELYSAAEHEYKLSPGDFPNLQYMKSLLDRHDFGKFKGIKSYMIEELDRMMSEDIPHLVSKIPYEDLDSDETIVKGGAFHMLDEQLTPFGYKKGEGIDAGDGDMEWVVLKDKKEYDAVFKSLNPKDGKIMRTTAKSEMIKSKLPSSVLGKIYILSDIDKDGLLDADEFALMLHLIKIKLDGHDLPTELPKHLIPPSKRELMSANVINN